MKSYYLYTVDGKTIGPMDETSVRSLIEAKILTSETQICIVGEDTWVPLTNLFPIDTPQQSETSPNVANQPNIATSPVSEAAEKPDTAETDTPEIKQIFKICYEKSLKFTQKIGQRLTPLFQRFIKWLRYQSTEDSKTTEKPNPEPEKASLPTATESSRQVPYSAIPYQYIPVSEVDPEPMPNLDWAAIARKYWTLKGRIDGKTFLKSFLLSFSCQLLAVGLIVLACFFTLGYYVWVCKGFRIWYSWYIPVGLYSLAAILYLYGNISMIPPMVRRLKDTGRHGALVIPIFIVALATGILWVIPGYFLSFLRGQYYPNRFGPRPQAGVTPWTSCTRIWFVGYAALLLWHIFVALCFWLYGYGREINVYQHGRVERVTIRSL